MKQDGEIEIGDVVALRSGGPRMTVNRAHQDDDTLNVRWFDGKIMMSEIVHRSAVRAVERTDSPANDAPNSSATRSTQTMDRGAIPALARWAPGVSFVPIDIDAGTLMSWDEFIDDAKNGTLSDSDGFGDLATATHVSDLEVHPSEIRSFSCPEWATHVFWYNK
jgi:uncharacterized protein YodC (DUF2158 family)